MVRIDWFQLIYDYVWFGWYVYNIGTPDYIDDRFYRLPTWISKHFEDERFSYCSVARSHRWHEKLVPIRKYGEGPPGWWLKMFGVYEWDNDEDD